MVRDGNFFKCQDQLYNQISGCALGDVDSRSYTDIAISDLFNMMVPACEIALSTVKDPFFKIYRDDKEEVLKILDFFNAHESTIKWTIPSCSECLQPQVVCQHYDHYIYFLIPKK